MHTVIPKDKILQALQPLPNETTVEEAIERLCFLAKVEEGLRQSERGETVSHEGRRKGVGSLFMAGAHGLSGAHEDGALIPTAALLNRVCSLAAS